VDKLYTVGFREVSGLNSFKNFKNLTTGCEDIAYFLVGYFILSHPVCLYSVIDFVLLPIPIHFFWLCILYYALSILYAVFVQKQG